MKVNEIIFESDFDYEEDSIEDEAESRGDAALITVLEWLRNEAAQSGAVTPRVKVDTIINRVKNIPGGEAFNFAALDAAYSSNDSVKSMIKSIKDDDKSGVKYVYLSSSESESEGAQAENEDDERQAAQNDKVVGGMAKRAAAKKTK